LKILRTISAAQRTNTHVANDEDRDMTAKYWSAPLGADMIMRPF
jgi:hypothetical protein